MKLTFFGAAGDATHGELGGVQTLFEDNETRFMLEFGQRPDLWNEFFGFPYGLRKHNRLELAERLQLYPQLEGIYRHDDEMKRGRLPGAPSLDAIVATHAHFDHIGGISLVRQDIPVWMSQDSKRILFAWQYTSGRTVNQFVDLVDQHSMVLNKDGKPKRLNGIEAVLPRDIRIYREGETFSVGDVNITAFPVDHSLPGACGLIIETSAGKFGWSGDIRMRGQHPEKTHRFHQALLEANLDYLVFEGSLFHFGHYGTEAELTNRLVERIEGKNFVGVSYPPRDFDRLTSVYNAAKKSKRMLVIPPAQALTLKVLDGVDGYPRLNWKYIGVLQLPKGHGLVGFDVPQEMIEKDYYKWERQFFRLQSWNGAEGKPQYVTLDDIKDNQDQFIVWVDQNNMANILGGIEPKENSEYLRLHPAPWTIDMEAGEQRVIATLKKFGIYKGPEPDMFNPQTTQKIPTLHVTGHFNEWEAKEFLEPFDCPIIPFHCMNPQDFVERVAFGKQLLIPQRGESMDLGGTPIKKRTVVSMTPRTPNLYEDVPADGPVVTESDLKAYLACPRKLRAKSESSKPRTVNPYGMRVLYFTQRRKGLFKVKDRDVGLVFPDQFRAGPELHTVDEMGPDELLKYLSNLTPEAFGASVRTGWSMLCEAGKARIREAGRDITYDISWYDKNDAGRLGRELDSMARNYFRMILEEGAPITGYMDKELTFVHGGTVMRARIPEMRKGGIIDEPRPMGITHHVRVPTEKGWALRTYGVQDSPLITMKLLAVALSAHRVPFYRLRWGIPDEIAEGWADGPDENLVYRHWNLKKGEIEETTRGPADVAFLEELIARYAEDVKYERLQPEHRHCGDCSFNMLNRHGTRLCDDTSGSKRPAVPHFYLDPQGYHIDVEEDLFRLTLRGTIDPDPGREERRLVKPVNRLAIELFDTEERILARSVYETVARGHGYEELILEAADAALHTLADDRGKPVVHELGLPAKGDGKKRIEATMERLGYDTVNQRKVYEPVIV